MLSIPTNGLNSIRRRSCDLDVLQRENAMQVERIRSKNESNQQNQQQQKRFSTLNLAKKLSNRLSVFNTNETKVLDLNDTGDNNDEREQLIQKESNYSIKIQLNPNKGQYIYRPGQSVQGKFTVNGQANKLTSFKRITIRVHGMMIFSRIENDETIVAGRKIGRKKWLFYDSKAMSYTKEELKNLGINPVPITGDLMGKQSLEMPFTFELPVRCISYQHSFKFIRQPAPLPPSMHFEIQQEQQQQDENNDFALDDENANEQNHNGRRSSIKKTWNTLKNKITGNKTLVATVQYMLTVTVEWQENFLRYHIAKCNLPFIVQPSPPSSTTFIHTITNSQSRQLLHLPAQRTNSEFSGNVFHENGENVLNDDLSQMQRARRPSITVNRQSVNEESNMENVSSWVDLMLKDTERGPQAWVFYHLYKRIATDQLIEVIFSHPATAALIMDTPIPFNVTISDANYTIQAGSISFNLLRTIRCISPGGELKLEKKVAQKRNMEGRKESIISLSEVNSTNQTDSTPPPTDEYSPQNYLDPSSNNNRNGLEGKLIIDSGIEENDDLLNNSKSVSVNAEKEQDSQDGNIHPCFSTSNKSQILIPSFNFRGLCVEYNLELNFDLIPRCENQDGSLMHISFQTPMVKVASRIQPVSSIYVPSQHRRARSALGLTTIPPADSFTEVDEERRRYPTRHSSLILESLITRQTPSQTQRPPEWNVNRTLPLPPSSETPESSSRQFPQRPPFRRTNQDDELTIELIRSSNESATSTTRRMSNDGQSAEYAEILSIPSLPAAGASSSSSSEDNSSCLENGGPEASVNDFESCLEPESLNSLPLHQKEARQPMLQAPSFDNNSISRANSPLSREDLGEVIDNIEQMTSIENTSYGYHAYLEGTIPHSINPRMSLISMRTIDGPAPPYIGTLQDL